MKVEWRREGYVDIEPVIGFIIYLAYNLHALRLYLTSPESTFVGSHIILRRSSVQRILETEVLDRGIFTAEISSNSTMASTWGTYSAALITLMFSLVTISVSTNGLFLYGDSNAAVKCSAIALFASLAFFCFQVGAKTLCHVNFHITLPEAGANYITEVVVRGFLYCEVGIRSFCFSLALTMWFFGPFLMLGASIVLVIFQYIRDRTPTSTVSLTLREPQPITRPVV